ncbi:MAG: serine/threonine-protein kinase [Myxococcota bacterium]
MARLGPYELLERVGVGGMAEVYKARQLGEEGFERHLAVKRILPGIASDPDFVAMFIDEAKIAVQLQHPNIAQVYDLGRDGEELFIALEFVEGRDMKTVVERQAKSGKKMPLSFAIYVVLKVCEALQHAHFARGSGGAPLNFIHRDISPQNILVSYEGAVKVIDFGLAKAAGRLSQTQAGVVKGKLAYLSSEQARGKEIDHRSDIFSLGTCLYEWLTGQRLFWRTGDMETVIAVQKAQVPPLRASRSDLPHELQGIVARALAANPDSRFRTASEMHEALMVFAVEAGIPIRRQVVAKHLSDLFPELAPKVVDPPKIEAPKPTRRPNIFADEATRALPRTRRPQAPPSSVEVISVQADDLIEIVDDASGLQTHGFDDVSAVPVVDYDSSLGPMTTEYEAPKPDDLTRSVRSIDLALGTSKESVEAAPAEPASAEPAPVAPAPADLGASWDDEHTVQLTADVVGGYLAEMVAERAESAHTAPTPRPPPKAPSDEKDAARFEDETSDGAVRGQSLQQTEFDDTTEDARDDVRELVEDWDEATDLGPSDTDHEALRPSEPIDDMVFDDMTFVQPAIPKEFAEPEGGFPDVAAALEVEAATESTPPLRTEPTQPSLQRPVFSDSTPPDE